MFEITYIHCLVVTRIFEKPHWKRSFLENLLICCCEFMHRSFANFGRIFFQAALVGLLFKKRSSKKEARIIKYQDKSKAYGFSSRSKVFMWKMLSRLCWDPAWPGQGENLCGVIQMQHQIYNCSHVISFTDHSFFLFLPGFQINSLEVLLLPANVEESIIRRRICLCSSVLWSWNCTHYFSYTCQEIFLFNCY